MGAWPYIGSFAFWIFLAIIIVSSNLFFYLRSRSRDRAIRDIARRGQPVPSKLFDLSPPTSRGGTTGAFLGEMT